MASALNVRRRPDFVVASIALLSLPLFFYGLGDTYLWQDEAQTALLGRSVLAHGVPMVGNGAASLSAVNGADAGTGGIYFQISWLQAYLAAASLKVFGESSWAARAPFALAGWLCVSLIAWVVRQAGGHVAAARLAALLTATSVPFIVCARQSRYYAVTSALTLVAAGTYAALTRRVTRPSSLVVWSIGFGAAAFLLVLSFDVTAIGVLAATAAHWLVINPQKARRDVRFWLPWTTAFAALAIWIVFSASAPIRQTHAVLSALPGRLRHGAPFYAGQIDAHVLPLPIAVLALVLVIRSNRAAGVLLGTLGVGAIGGAMLSPYRFFRYAVPAIPLIYGIAALALVVLAQRGRGGKLLAGAIVAGLITSTAPFALSHALSASVARASGVVTVRDRRVDYRVPLAEMIQEFRDPPRGPVAAAVEYLRRHAGADDVLVTTYGELPLKFHTALAVYGGETGQLPPHDTPADWIWPRHRTTLYPAERAAVEWVERELARGAYQRIELTVVDRRWENREDPEEHIFTNPGPDGPPVVLYRLKSGAE